jgi:cell division protein ZipA
MELREWLIILGLALVTLIVVDGVRRLQRQRRTPRLDQVDTRGDSLDPEAAAREAEINWELPNGGARVVRPADYSGMQPKPKLQRQEHPGPSRVLSGLRSVRPEPAAGDGPSYRQAPRPVTDAEAPARGAGPRPTPIETAPASPGSLSAETAETAEPGATDATAVPGAPAEPGRIEAGRDARDLHRTHEPEVAGAEPEEASADGRREPSLSALDETLEPPSGADHYLAADPEDHDDQDVERYRLVDLDGVGDSLLSGSRRVGSSLQRSFSSLQKGLAGRREQRRLEKARRDQQRAEKAERDAELRREAQAQAEREKAEREEARRRREADAIDQADDDDPLFAPPRHREEAVAPAPAAAVAEAPQVPPQDDKVRTHPVLEKALRHDVSAEHARHSLSHAEEIIVISVMSRDEAGFSGTALLDLMLACGLRYSRDMGIFHRFETEDPDSQLQFSMVNVVKPGTFPIEAMDDFHTPGVTLLMPLPGASDTAAAFEAMVETAMVVVRHLGGELKDENHSVMTAQTVGFARQRVQEFERRHRLHRYQAN